MIYKLDHIARVVTNIDQVIESLCLKGYEIDFCFKRIQPLPSILQVCSMPIKCYDEVLLYSKKGFSLQFLSLEYKKSLSKTSVCSCTSTEFINDNLTLFTPDIKQSIEFWKLSGFNLSKVDENSYLLSKRIFDGQQQIILQKTSSRPELNYFDSQFSHLSLFSTDIKADFDLFQEYAITDINILSFPDRTLNIFFARSPNGCLIEVVGKC